MTTEEEPQIQITKESEKKKKKKKKPKLIVKPNIEVKGVDQTSALKPPSTR